MGSRPIGIAYRITAARWTMNVTRRNWRHGDDRPGGPRGPQSHAPIAAITASVAVLSVLLLASPALGAIPAWRNTAPFHKAASHVGLAWYNHRGCANLTKIQKGFWNRSTGIGGWALNESIPNCHPGHPPDGYGNLRLTSNVSVPLNLRSSSRVPTRIDVRWALASHGTVALMNGTCPPIILNATGDGSLSCLMEAREVVTQSAYLRDTTNGSLIYPTSSPREVVQVAFSIISNVTTCHAYYCTNQYFQAHLNHTSFNWSHLLTWRFNVMLDPTHAYSVVSIVGVEITAQVLGAINASVSLSDTYLDRLVSVQGN